MSNAQKLQQRMLDSLFLTKHSAGFGDSCKSECFREFVFPVCLSPTKCLEFLFGSEITAMGEGQKGLRLWNVCCKECGNAVRIDKAWASSLWEAVEIGTDTNSTQEVTGSDTNFLGGLNRVIHVLLIFDLFGSASDSVCPILDPGT